MWRIPRCLDRERGWMGAEVGARFARGFCLGGVCVCRGYQGVGDACPGGV